MEGQQHAGGKRFLPHYNYLSWARDRFSIARTLWHYIPSIRSGLVKVKGGVYLRAGDQHDQEVYDAVFIRREYDVEIPEPRTIVDAGAHIGLASVWFARRFPRARIIAIEPDDDNFALLKKNTRGLNVLCLKQGLWHRDGHLRIENPEAGSWSFRVVECCDGPIESTTVDYLIRRYGKVDCLKLDIEGSEVPVLANSRGWIRTIDTLIVELHDKEPGAHACQDALDFAVDGLALRRQQSGENIVLVPSDRASVATRQ
jgi:FkbM family methyltransferase